MTQRVAIRQRYEHSELALRQGGLTGAGPSPEAGAGTGRGGAGATGAAGLSSSSAPAPTTQQVRMSPSAELS